MFQVGTEWDIPIFHLDNNALEGSQYNYFLRTLNRFHLNTALAQMSIYNWNKKKVMKCYNSSQKPQFYACSNIF